MVKNLNFSKKLYKKLYLIRKSEQEIIHYYPEDEMKTPMHMSMGEEAIVVGICESLEKKDQVFGTYRSHALYLARTSDTDDFFAELYARDSAFLKGKGGSMHLCAPEYGLLGTSAIVASAIPVAVGTAFANKVKKNGALTAVFFGDGAIDEGNFWESINIACLMQLPIIFVCEDNGLAVHTADNQRHGYHSISEIISKFKCQVFQSDSTAVEDIHTLAKAATEYARNSSQPCFLHLKYYRYLEHVGIAEDFDAGYRNKSEYNLWLDKDPVKIQKEHLLSSGCPENEINLLEQEINKQITKSINAAKRAPLSAGDEIYSGVFA